MERKEIKVGSAVRDVPQVARKINGLGTCRRSKDENKEEMINESIINREIS